VNDIFTSVISGFIFMQGSTVGRGSGHACSALNLGCEITIKGKQLTGTAKWEDILKLCEIDKQNVLHNVMHRQLNQG
jgi:hypothetical protein